MADPGEPAQSGTTAIFRSIVGGAVRVQEFRRPDLGHLGR
jgi:hypothetical protein